MESPSDRLVGSHLNLIRDHDDHPLRGPSPPRGKPLRVTPYGLYPPRLAAHSGTYTTSWDTSRRLPEIKDEWTDDVLRAPADALPPVMRRYAGQVSEWAARFPELVALGVSPEE